MRCAWWLLTTLLHLWSISLTCQAYLEVLSALISFDRNGPQNILQVGDDVSKYRGDYAKHYTGPSGQTAVPSSFTPSSIPLRGPSLCAGPVPVPVPGPVTVTVSEDRTPQSVTSPLNSALFCPDEQTQCSSFVASVTQSSDLRSSSVALIIQDSLRFLDQTHQSILCTMVQSMLQYW